MNLDRRVARRERILVALSRRIDFAGLLEREPQVIEELRIARMIAKGFLVDTDRLGGVAALARRVAEIEHRLGVRRIDC